PRPRRPDPRGTEVRARRSPGAAASPSGPSRSLLLAMASPGLITRLSAAISDVRAHEVTEVPSSSTPNPQGGPRAHGRRRTTQLLVTGGLVLGGLVTGAAALLGSIPAAAGAALASALLAKKTGEGGLSTISVASVAEGLAGTAMAVWLSQALRPRPSDL